jgi:SAM-dependent methyltransferase
MGIIKLFVKKFFPRKILNFILNQYCKLKGERTARQYQGNSVLCPCCGKIFCQFMDHKICPFCLSLPQHRIVCHYLNKNKEIISSKKSILFGAEFSIRIWFERNGCHYITADLLDLSADITVDTQKTPFLDESWGVIIGNHILEQVPDYNIALKELKRILKKDGILALTVPTDRNFETAYEDASIVTKEELINLFGQANPVRILGNDLEKIVTNAGFSFEIVDRVIGPKNGDDNRVYICRKK